VSATATVAGVVYLYVRIITAGNGGEDSRTAYANWETCQRAAQSARIVVSSGGDAESVAMAWCGGGSEAQFWNSEAGRYEWRPVQRVAK
jgi:hypothetical protein